jgi:nitroreductase
MFFDILRKRRSIRSFSNRPLTENEIELLKEAALRSPSSRNIDPWEFIFVMDTNLLARLSLSKEHGSEFLRGASLGVVVLADSSLSDVWIEDASIASTYLFLAAEALDLGACWIQIRNRTQSPAQSSASYVRELLCIPPHLEVLSLIAIGPKGEKRKPLEKEKLKRSKIFLNTYQTKEQ